MTTTNHAIAAAYRRAAARVRDYERENLPHDGDVLAQWHAGRRAAAMEIAEWLEARADEYEQECAHG